MRLIDNAPASAAATPLARWRAPQITDRRAFLDAHPECEVSVELLEKLEPYIRFRARQIEPVADADLHADLVAEITASIIECATHYRSTDPDSGLPIFDYLAQAPSYVVQHAAGKAYSAVRRQRTADRHLRPQFLSAGNGYDNGEEDEDLELIDRSLPDMAQLADDSELIDAIAAALRNPLRRKIFRLLMAGADRGEVGLTLGLARQRVHDHVLIIRQVAERVLSRRAQQNAEIERRYSDRSRRPGVAPFAARRPSHQLAAAGAFIS